MQSAQPDNPEADVAAKARVPESAKKTKRMPSDERRALIVRKAADFFAEHGFDATTRELAKHLGTTQPLLYKYFKGKEDLIDEIYKSVFLDVWDNRWDDILADRGRPIVDRLVDFYTRYTDVIMDRRWLRTYLFAGLKGVGITSSYIKLVEERVIRRIVIEICAAKGAELGTVPSKRQLEIGWSLQGSIFYHGVRKYAYGLDPHIDKNTMIVDVVRIYLAGWQTDAADGN